MQFNQQSSNLRSFSEHFRSLPIASVVGFHQNFINTSYTTPPRYFNQRSSSSSSLSVFQATSYVSARTISIRLHQVGQLCPRHQIYCPRLSPSSKGMPCGEETSSIEVQRNGLTKFWIGERSRLLQTVS